MSDETPPKQEAKLSFSLEDMIGDVEVSPSYITVAMLNDFVNDVARFLRGSRQTDIKGIRASIVEGSLAVVARGDRKVIGKAVDDYTKIIASHDLSDVDPVRRDIILSWKKQADENEHRRYVVEIDAGDAESGALEITNKSLFTTKNEVWVEVEKY